MKHRIEIFVAMNEDGDFEVAATDADDARNYLSENCGGSLCRVVKLTLRMAPPVVEDGPEIDVPDGAGDITEAAAAE